MSFFAVLFFVPTPTLPSARQGGLTPPLKGRLGNILVLIAVISLCTTVQFCAKPAAFQPFFVRTLHLRTDAVRADGGKGTAVISAAAAAAPLPQKTKIAVVSTDRHRIHTSPRRLHSFRLDAAAVLHAARLARLFFILHEDFARKFPALSAEAPPLLLRASRYCTLFSAAIQPGHPPPKKLSHAAQNTPQRLSGSNFMLPPPLRPFHGDQDLHQAVIGSFIPADVSLDGGQVDLAILALRHELAVDALPGFAQHAG